jgi:hypothetical protein
MLVPYAGTGLRLKPVADIYDCPKSEGKDHNGVHPSWSRRTFRFGPPNLHSNVE